MSHYTNERGSLYSYGCVIDDRAIRQHEHNIYPENCSDETSSKHQFSWRVWSAKFVRISDTEPISYHHE